MCDVGVYPLLGTNYLYTLPLNLAATTIELPRAFTFLAVGDHVFQILLFGSGSLAEVTQFKTYSCTWYFCVCVFPSALYLEVLSQCLSHQPGRS